MSALLRGYKRFQDRINNEIPSLSGNKCIERVLTFCSMNLYYAHTNA